MSLQLTIPKVITLQTATFKDRRSLAWLNGDVDPAQWKHHEGIVSSLSQYAQYKDSIPLVGIILLNIEGNEDEFFEHMYHISKDVTLLLLSNRVLSRKKPGYWEDNFDNILNLSDLHAQYPFIGPAWDGTVEDAVAIYASLIRYQRVVGLNVEKLSDGRQAQLALHSIKCANCDVGGVTEPSCTLVTQFYKPGSGRRFRELKEVLEKNCACPWIDHIVLLNEQDYSVEWSGFKGAEKIQQIVIGERLTYAHFLRYATEESVKNTYLILSNADIYFGIELRELWKVDMCDKMFALLRWDVQTDGRVELFGPRNDSQDSWIFLSDSVKRRTWDYDKFEYTLGTLGCDNKFMTDIVRMKFVVSNPALTIKSYHLHMSNSRTYDKNTRLTPDVFILMEPSVLLDTLHITNLGRKPVKILTNGSVEFEVKSSTPSNAIIYCTALEKGGRFKWNATEQNSYFDRIPVYEWTNASVTGNGLVYDMWNIYKGPSSVTDIFWKQADIHAFTPMQKRSIMIAIPLKDTSCFHNFDRYCVEYLSRVIRVIKEFGLQGSISFWIPPQFESLMGQFDFDVLGCSIDGARYNGETTVYADRVIGILPDTHEIGKEDVEGLQQLCPYWEQSPIHKIKKCVIVMDHVFTQDFCKEVSKLFEGWNMCTLNAGSAGVQDEILGASACIFFGGPNTSTAWSKLWALPTGCAILEFQEELSVDGEFQHFTHIGGFNSWVYLLGRSNMATMHSSIIGHITKWINKL